ncbi:MAG: hypothetical protein ACN6NT_10815 [Comamonas sp.]
MTVSPAQGPNAKTDPESFGEQTNTSYIQRTVKQGLLAALHATGIKEKTIKKPSRPYI